MMAAPTFEERAEVTLREVTVTPHGRWQDCVCATCHKASTVYRGDAQARRPNDHPDGNTLIYAGDEAVIATLAS